MGKYNSSEYRVKPLMTWIKDNEDNFGKFIKLIADLDLKKPDSEDFYYADKSEKKKEKGLLPTKKHLIELVKYLFENGKSLKSDIPIRQKLFNGKDEDIKQLAIQEIENNYPKKCSRTWYIFEGPTYPDFYIEGDGYVIIGEGKWTEPHLTNETTFLHITDEGKGRNQMIRHIQGAINANKENTKIIAFYIVDEKREYYQKLASKKEEEKRFSEQVDKEIISIDDDEKEKIVSAYYGMITWQDIEKALDKKFQKQKN